MKRKVSYKTKHNELRDKLMQYYKSCLHENKHHKRALAKNELEIDRCQRFLGIKPKVAMAEQILTKHDKIGELEFKINRLDAEVK